MYVDASSLYFVKLSIHTVYVSLFNTKQFITAFKYSLLVFLMAWSTTYYIHSSELWSVYISKNTFNFDFLGTISMKPFFNLFLYLFHLLPLSDVQHLAAVKFFFSLIGVIQYLLLWNIFKKCIPEFNLKRMILFVLFTLFVFSSYLYLQNFFRIRSDQICITLFLYYIYLNSNRRLTVKLNFLFIALYPLVAIKGILFSFLHFSHFLLIHRKSIFTKKHVYLYALALIAILISVINFSWNGVLYLIDTTHSFSDSLTVFNIWVKSDFIIISLSIFSVFNMKYQRHIEEILKINLSLMSLLSLIVIFLFPQKHTYFIASFMPIFLLNSSTYVYYLYQIFVNSKILDINPTTKKICVCILILFFIVFKYENYYRNNPYRSNLSEFKFISTLSEIISLNNMSYIDGFGAMPR